MVIIITNLHWSPLHIEHLVLMTIYQTKLFPVSPADKKVQLQCFRMLTSLQMCRWLANPVPPVFPPQPSSSLLGGVFLSSTLVICLVIFRMHRKTADMECTLTSMNFDESSIESPSLRKKADSDEPDTKASNDNNREPPLMLGGPDLTKDELEEADHDEHWRGLLPKEDRSSGHSLEHRDSHDSLEMHLLKRTQSRDSHGAFEVGGVRSVKRSQSRDSQRAV